MQSNREVEIGDVTYSVTTFPAHKGLGYLQKLLKIVGPAIGEIFSKAAVEGGDFEAASIEDEALSGAIKELTQNMDKENVAQLIQDMIKDGVTKSGQPVQFNQEFSGNYGALVSLVGAIVKDNYSSFFGESGFGKLQELIPLPQSKEA